jgi:hypothetical protein
MFPFGNYFYLDNSGSFGRMTVGEDLNEAHPGCDRPTAEPYQGQRPRVSPTSQEGAVYFCQDFVDGLHSIKS